VQNFKDVHWKKRLLNILWFNLGRYAANKHLLDKLRVMLGPFGDKEENLL
jgi:hypothetical protein